MRKLKLGTRKSLLAWAQSSWVARELEKRNNVQVELVGIETRGDKVLDISLQALAKDSGGKEFFVAELDDALVSGTVDLTVHSMKDLSLDRPDALICGAIPLRENPRDAVLFGPGVLQKIANGQTLRIGTSSPRRCVNIPPFLSRALPTRNGQAPKVDLVEIRGNVNTRLSRVHESGERHLDGVVLAFAGLIRLWNDESGRRELSKLLKGVRWMILPLSESPSAPAQGALAIECRRADSEVAAILSKIHDEQSARLVAREREILRQWGGGCHQKFGATAVQVRTLGEMMFVRGEKPDGTFVDERRWTAPSERPSQGSAWQGSKWREKTEASDRELQWECDGRAVFVAHARAVRPDTVEKLEDSRVWTSGVGSWAKLASQGVWVEGCAENLGYEFLSPQLQAGVLQLPAQSEWVVLTHADALEGWPGVAQAIATYEVDSTYGADAVSELKSAKNIFWSSGSQFDKLHHHVAEGATHACGPGKTAEKIIKAGLRVYVFPSAEEWNQWLKNR